MQVRASPLLSTWSHGNTELKHRLPIYKILSSRCDVGAHRGIEMAWALIDLTNQTGTLPSGMWMYFWPADWLIDLLIDWPIDQFWKNWLTAWATNKHYRRNTRNTVTNTGKSCHFCFKTVLKCNFLDLCPSILLPKIPIMEKQNENNAFEAKKVQTKWRQQQGQKQAWWKQ